MSAPITNQMGRASEVTKLLSISNATLYRWVNQGKIKSYKVSSGVTLYNINEIMTDLGLNGDVSK